MVVASSISHLTYRVVEYLYIVSLLLNNFTVFDVRVKEVIIHHSEQQRYTVIATREEGSGSRVQPSRWFLSIFFSTMTAQRCRQAERFETRVQVIGSLQYIVDRGMHIQNIICCKYVDVMQTDIPSSVILSWLRRTELTNKNGRRRETDQLASWLGASLLLIGLELEKRGACIDRADRGGRLSRQMGAEDPHRLSRIGWRRPGFEMSAAHQLWTVQPQL